MSCGHENTILWTMFLLFQIGASKQIGPGTSKFLVRAWISEHVVCIIIMRRAKFRRVTVKYYYYYYYCIVDKINEIKNDRWPHGIC